MPFLFHLVTFENLFNFVDSDTTTLAGLPHPIHEGVQVLKKVSLQNVFILKLSINIIQMLTGRMCNIQVIGF